MASAFSALNRIPIPRTAFQSGVCRDRCAAITPSSNNGRDFRFVFARRDNATDGFPEHRPCDQVWMFGHRPIRQVLDGVDVLFLYEGSAHVGVKLTGFREGSTFHRAN
jgi:hypothetical protein